MGESGTVADDGDGVGHDGDVTDGNDVGGARPGPRVLVVENSPGSPVGRLGPWLEADGVAVDLHRGREGLPDSLDGYHGLILLGGGFMSDDATAPWRDQERRLAREAINRDLPTLSVCLGAQLLVLVAGGEVRAAYRTPPSLRPKGWAATPWRLSRFRASQPPGRSAGRWRGRSPGRSGRGWPSPGRCSAPGDGWSPARLDAQRADPTQARPGDGAHVASTPRTDLPMSDRLGSGRSTNLCV